MAYGEQRDPVGNVLRADARGPEHVSGHPYSATTEVRGWLLSRAVGLTRIAVNLVSIAPGKTSAPFHVHHREEEWAYVLEGDGVAEVNDAEHRVGPGDFLGYAPGVAHHLRNEGGRPLVLLEGGEILSDVEVADFPKLARRLVRVGNRLSVYAIGSELPFLPGTTELPQALLGARDRSTPRVLVRSGERPPPRRYSHPENPRSEVELTSLSRAAGGLSRVAVGVTRVPAGRESYVRHVHLHDEEWLLVLSGRGTVELDDREEEIGPGDFAGFPARGPAHHVRAASGEDLVYVHGGDAWAASTVEIVDFPGLGLRKTFVGTRENMTFPLAAALGRSQR